jgi:DNA-binding transcriptional LysR family regulator
LIINWFESQNKFLFLIHRNTYFSLFDNKKASMHINQLKNFLRIAETLNFRQAAEQNLIAQPALSRQIQQLEQEIGVELFRRDRRNVELTEGGKHYRKEVERLLYQLDMAGRRAGEVQRGEAGEIRMGHASSTMQSILPGFLRKIKDTLPNLKTVLFEATNRNQIEMLRHREIDFGFMPNIILPEDIAFRVIYSENFDLILPADHPLSIDTFSSLADVAHEPFILPTRKEGMGYVESVEKMCQAYGFTPHIEHESPNAASVLRMVEAGLGISIMGKSALNGVLLDVKTIELEDVPFKLDMRLSWLREREKELESFLKLMEQYLPS